MNKYLKESKRAQRERIRRRGCSSKVAFRTPTEAYQKGQEMYRCRWCGNYHRSGSLARLAAKVRR